MYDVIIVGAGPAGISSAIYLKRANKNVLVLYYGESNLEKAELIDNYYGFENGISGKELYENGIKQAQKLGVEVKKEEVLHIEKKDNFIVKTNVEEYKGKVLILANGNKKIKPDISGITEFEGKGVSYCAVCDGFFFKNKDVVVIGDGSFAKLEAEYLNSVVNSVKILTNGNKIENLLNNVSNNLSKNISSNVTSDLSKNVSNSVLNNKSNNLSNFEIIQGRIKQIKGDTKVRKIEFEDGSSLDVDGIFIAIGEAGSSDFAKRIGIITSSDDSIIVDENMATNVEGVYACGNSTGGLLQVCKAVYEGAQAGISVINYLNKKG